VFFFNDSGADRSFALADGKWETWDAFTGNIAPLKETSVTLPPGRARLLRVAR
jgi:hypothetical protein